VTLNRDLSSTIQEDEEVIGIQIASLEGALLNGKGVMVLEVTVPDTNNSNVVLDQATELCIRVYVYISQILIFKLTIYEICMYVLHQSIRYNNDYIYSVFVL